MVTARTRAPFGLLPRQHHAHLVVVPVDVLALPFVAAQGVAGGEAFFDGNLKHLKSLPETAAFPSSRRSRGKAAGSPGKVYHTACAGCGCRGWRAPRGPTGRGSGARSPASKR